ncbi:hypothetical protein LGH70_09390 [Hymenobacter sp. BT635]|uniref:Uncharacterized protein n=1 Tax=Hymenobacter nitidus TaxID=2880929 RepID=A0ABS8AEE0_9BACT|nr:hypothetical protein [Hymenobacter nitidus]MCB2377794.1 hypothetical protein [Hymenobacter nitidus]
MDSQQAWRKILDAIPADGRELHTVPITKKQPVWFAVNRELDLIWVTSASQNSPSSILTLRRRLSFKKFNEILPYFFRRAQGESVSKEVCRLTMNQVYYFSLIEHILL